MSGIGGIFNLDGSPIDPRDLHRLREAIAHRGPDGSRIWSSANVGLVHNLLQIDSEPAQPLERKNRCLIMDGRIDNIPVLQKWLSRRGYAHNDEISSPEIVLEALERLGEKSLPLFLGDFALALWNADDGELILARDPIGVKPLYYFCDGRRLIFCSEAKGILAVAGVPCEPDKDRLAEGQRYRFRFMERTFFQDIRRLPPGESLRASVKGLKKRRFWEPNPQRQITLSCREDYRARFRKLFLEAVKCRLPRKGKAALRLSGGLDSSAVAGACAQLRDERPELSVHTISMLSDRFSDERRHVRTVCQAFDFDNIPLIAENQDITRDLEEFVHFQESPLFSPLDVWSLRLHENAARLGAKVVLGGDWGDQVMGNCAYLVDILREGQLLLFWSELKQHMLREPGSYKFHLKRIFWYMVLPARISDRYDGLRYLLRFAIAPWRPVEPGGPAFPRAVQREHYDGVFGIHNVHLLEVIDRVAAQCGVEARLPFLDRRLIAYTMSIPWEENVRDGLSRALEREALNGILPDAIAQRTDKGDCTESILWCLKKAGFGRAEESGDEWDRKMKSLWEETWIQRRGIRKNTPARSLSSSGV